MIQQKPCLISTIRQPLRTLLLSLLLGLISFAFIGKAAEYLVIQRETTRLGSYYHVIGSLQKINDPQNTDISLGADIVKSSPYLAYEDRRQYGLGVMEGIYNDDTFGLDAENSGPNAGMFKGINIDSFWFFGVLKSKKEVTQTEGSNEKVGYSFTFEVNKVVTGYPEYIKEGQTLNLLFLSKGHEDAVPAIEAMEEGQSYFVRGWFDAYFTPDPGWQNGNSKVQLRSLDDKQTWYLPVRQGEEVDINDPTLAAVKNEVEIAEQNQHTLTIISTADMSAMPDTQQSSHLYYLIQGRWLNHEDDLNKNKVIVIQERLAQSRGLKIGDKIVLNFRMLKNPNFGYIISEEDRQNWRSYPTSKESFEIVGTFGATVGIGANLAFIPNSALLPGFEQSTSGLDSFLYSFVLKSFQNENAFVNENQNKMAQLGIGLTFVDNNGKNFWSGVQPLKQSASASVLIFGGVLLIALTLAVFFYLTQRRRDYAILRALGVPKTWANRQMLLPIALIGAVGILIGGISSWQYALAKAAASLSTLPTPAGQVPSATLNPGYLAALCAGIFVLLLVFAWVGIALTARRPVLELLQGETARAGKKQKPDQSLEQSSLPNLQSVSTIVAHVPPSSEQLDSIVFATTGQIPAKRSQKNGTLIRFILRHTSRSSLKSFLIIVVASGFMLALGWMQWTMEKDRAEVDRLYETTTVKAEIVQKNAGVSTSFGSADITGDLVVKMLQSGFLRNPYLEALSGIVHMNRFHGATESSDVSLLVCGIDQPETFFFTTMQGAVVEYAPGWDESLFTKTWTLDEVKESGVPVVFPEDLFKQYELKMGEKLSMTDRQGQTYTYIVSGEYFFGTIGYSESRIMLPLSALKEMEGKALMYNVARFDIDPAKNKELSTLKAKMDQMLAKYSAGFLPLQIVLWDEELRTVVTPLEKNLSLLRILYPVTFAISVLIGAGLSLLLLLQTAKEAALLRALGVTKIKVRAVLSSEHLLLSLIGIALGLVALVLLRQDPGVLLAGSTLIAAGLYLVGVFFGSVFGATAITRRQPMELLQVKE
jgi:ABC-type antimicrobial peptide transport system permease subunit